MPLEFELEDQLLVFRSIDDVDYAEGLQVLNAGLSAARTRQAKQELRFDILFDLRRSTEKRKSDDMRSIAEIIAQNRDVLSGRGAVIAGADLHYGMARIFAVYSEEAGVKISVFRDRESARRWLEATDTDSQDAGE